MFGKNISTLFGKFTLSFIVVSLMIGVSILVLFYSHKKIVKNNEVLNSVSSLMLDLESIYRVSKNKKSLNEDYKLSFSNQIDEFRVGFDLLVGTKLNEEFISRDSSGVEISLSSLSNEEQLLYLSHGFWNKIRKHADYIQYNELVYDSLYTIVTLQTKWDVSDSTNKFLPLVNELSKKTLTPEAKNAFHNIHVLVRKMTDKFTNLYGLYDVKHKTLVRFYVWAAVFLILLNLCVLYFVYKYLSSQIFDSIHKIKSETKKIIEGDISLKLGELNKDELGEIAAQINLLTFDIRNAHHFIKNLNLDDVQEVALAESGGVESTLTQALIEMKDKLTEISLKENQRNWTIEGQALFSDILSKYSADFTQLSDEIVRKLVTYVGALQGGLFIVNKTDGEKEECLELASCFAYDRKKFVNNRVEKGEGVVGQVWQEGKGVFITDLPDDHMLIKSGLGDQRPSSLLVLPLIENSVIYGVIELASFKRIEQYKVDFVYKIAENIATALSGVEINKRTQMLLLESQDLTVKMKEQEEEMLQNLEELQATQEEMRRREIQKENEMSQLQERLEKRLESSEAKEKELHKEIVVLKNEVENAQLDNEGVRNLTKEIEELKLAHDLKVKDLEETIRIKDMRVDKLRKKLSNKKDSDS